ncbi:hypothetical protein CDQ91_06790 [Sphingopyxis witflariensis]|uniref:Uncharacterized protein n=1 Tax=Sphingopyxis witflariensis TaxID=173675 RepID=A0A246K013_9SPHN|nr:hypothetical protein CDQ91_06790 [Sphingopyxis witflariensis]
MLYCNYNTAVIRAASRIAAREGAAKPASCVGDGCGNSKIAKQANCIAKRGRLVALEPRKAAH